MTGLRTWDCAPRAVRLVCALLLLSLVVVFVAAAAVADDLTDSLGGEGAVVVLVLLVVIMTAISAGLAYGLVRGSALVWLLMVGTTLASTVSAAQVTGVLDALGLLSSVVMVGALLSPATIRWCWTGKAQRRSQSVPDLRRPD